MFQNINIRLFSAVTRTTYYFWAVKSNNDGQLVYYGLNDLFLRQSNKNKLSLKSHSLKSYHYLSLSGVSFGQYSLLGYLNICLFSKNLEAMLFFIWPWKIANLK